MAVAMRNASPNRPASASPASASASRRPGERSRSCRPAAASALPPLSRSLREAGMSEVAATGISVLLVDDHPIVRQGYRRVLESQGDLHVVAEADNAADAYGAFKAHDPDVVVLDISMPGASGLEAIRNIRARSPRARILVFTMHNEAVLVKAAFSAGASGFVTKSSEPSSVVGA